MEFSGGWGIAALFEVTPALSDSFRVCSDCFVHESVFIGMCWQIYIPRLDRKLILFVF